MRAKENMQIPQWITDLFLHKKYRLGKHILFWLFIYADEVLSFVGVTESLEIEWYLIIFEILVDMCMVYLNIFFLLPKFLLKGKVVAYLALTLLTIVFTAAFNFYLFHDEVTVQHLLTYLFSGSVTNAGLVAMAVAIKMMEESYLYATEIRELQKNNLETELAYLKTQVNPHFLFNTLNNMYIMSKMKSDKLPNTIMQLSDLLRYQLYDTKTETVLIANEVDYLKNYIQLEKLRREHLKVDFQVTGSLTDKHIRPLVLLPIIENAFKYSNSGTGSDYIHIKLDLTDTAIDFSVENNKGTLHQRRIGGIGIVNVSRRLELAYPNRHDIVINEDADKFNVAIKIDLR